MRATPLCLLALVPCLLPALAGAATDEASIGHWGSYLMVTAPATASDGKLDLSMQQRVTVDFADTPLSEAAAFLHQVTGCNIVLDPKLLAANPTITFKARDMQLGTVLRWVTQLTKANVGYVDNVVVLAQDPVQGATKTVLYDVSDLTMGIQDFPGRELAYNAGSGAGQAIWAQAPAQEAHSSTTVEELEDLLRKQTLHEK